MTAERRGPAALSIRDVTFHYNGSREPAVTDISLDVRPGEVVAICGPNGCGKSTLLRLLAGFRPPSRGGVFVDGQPKIQCSPETVIVGPTASLFAWSTVLRNVTFGLELSGMSPAEQSERAREMLNSLGLLPFERLFPSQLSAGMQQKLALARALIVRPRLLLLDEPFAHVDWQSRRELQRELLRLVEGNEHFTTVLVTHDVEEAVHLADRVALMSDRPGRLVSIDTVDLPRPRNDAMRADRRAVELCERLAAHLHP